MRYLLDRPTIAAWRGRGEGERGGAGLHPQEGVDLEKLHPQEIWYFNISKVSGVGQGIKNDIPYKTNVAAKSM